jgi:hypothetical protein
LPYVREVHNVDEYRTVWNLKEPHDCV